MQRFDAVLSILLGLSMSDIRIHRGIHVLLVTVLFTNVSCHFLCF